MRYFRAHIDDQRLIVVLLTKYSFYYANAALNFICALELGFVIGVSECPLSNCYQVYVIFRFKAFYF